MIVIAIESFALDILIGFAFGILVLYVASLFKGILAYRKAWEKSIERLGRSTYEYKLFENYINITIYRENEKVHELKCPFTDIEQIQQLGNWFFLQLNGQLFIIRKIDLSETSAFYSWMYKNPSRTVDSPIPSKWKNLSVLLFVASLLSLYGAAVIVTAISRANGLFEENMWVFFLMTPIPLSSIIYGFWLKHKGYKYKKNIIVGFIVIFFLCAFGSFVFFRISFPVPQAI